MHFPSELSLTLFVFSQSPNVVDDLLEEVEALYATRFGKLTAWVENLPQTFDPTTHLLQFRAENGDKKKARDRLRVSASTKTHHGSTFRTGIYVGVALPALIHSLVLSETNRARFRHVEEAFLTSSPLSLEKQASNPKLVA